MLVEFKGYLTCGAAQRELSCVWMRCGAACGLGLRTQRSMRMHFLLSAPSLNLRPFSATLRPNWTNPNGLHNGIGLVGNKQFFTCGTSQNLK